MTEAGPVWERAFYCVANAAHFVGAVALLDSLRLTGHDDPFVVLDCGLRRDQRMLLDGHATLVDAPSDMRAPTLVKWAAPLARPAETMVLCDADVMVVSSLEPVLAEARHDRVVAFSNGTVRSHPAWADVLGLDALPEAPYVNAGFLVVPGSLADAVVAGVRDLQQSLDLSRSRGLGGSAADPFYLADQDSWNAVLACRATGRVTMLEQALAPPPNLPVRVVDRATLECRVADGRRPFLLHQWGPKPWLVRTPPSAYGQLLPRVLGGRDVALRIPRGEIPPRLRGHLARRADRYAYALAFRTRRRLRPLVRARSRRPRPA